MSIGLTFTLEIAYFLIIILSIINCLIQKFFSTDAKNPQVLMLLANEHLSELSATLAGVILLSLMLLWPEYVFITEYYSTNYPLMGKSFYRVNGFITNPMLFVFKILAILFTAFSLLYVSIYVTRGSYTNVEYPIYMVIAL